MGSQRLRHNWAIKQFISHECHEISLDLVLFYGFRIPGFLCLVSTHCVGFNFKFISWSIRAAPIVASTCTFQLAKRRKRGKGMYPFKLSSKSCSYNIHLHILHHRAYFGNNNTHPQMDLGISSSFWPNSVLPYSSFSSVMSSWKLGKLGNNNLYPVKLKLGNRLNMMDNWKLPSQTPISFILLQH